MSILLERDDEVGFLQQHKGLFIGILVTALLAGGGYKYYQTKKAKEAAAAVKTAEVQKGDVQATVSATGALSAVDSVDISSKITGRITAVYVKENDVVTAGQLLVKLDDTSLLATQKQKEALMLDAKLTYDRDATLLQQGAIAKSIFDTAEANYIVAKAAYDQAVSNTNDTNIYTPISGYVIGKPTPVGQTISSGISTPQVIMSVATLDRMQIKLMVDESDIGQIQNGQKVDFTVDAYPDRTFTGIVTLISRSATTTNNVNYYTCYVDVDNSDGKLLPTMTARATVIIKSTKDALTVPLNCVRTKNKEKFVQVYDEKTRQTTDVPITIVLSGDDKVAVKGNLTPGQKLLVKEVKGTSGSKNMGPMGGPPR